MTQTSIKATVNGPYEVIGDVEVVDAKGQKRAFKGTSVRLCRCGCSKNKPYCDGSHKTCGFKDPS